MSSDIIYLHQKSYYMRYVVALLFFILIAGSNNSFSQDSEKRKFYVAEELVDGAVFDSAIVLYKELLLVDSANANINFKTGFCYLQTKLEKHMAIDYLEVAVQNVAEDILSDDFYEERAPVEAFYFLGQAYRINYEFMDAIDTLKYLKDTYLTEDDGDFIKMIDWELQMCYNGIDLERNSLEIMVTNLGSKINTKYSEHSPVFSADESVLIFTSKREGSTGGVLTEEGQYDEDIYISYNNDGIWSEPVSIGDSINTPGHEATIGLSVDGQQLFIYKDDNGDGNIYISELYGDKWSAPRKMGSNINTRFRETHASLAANGKSLYFSSTRPGGFGGSDIYVVHKLPDGKWSKAQNMGPKVNTVFNEEGPYIHPDGVTLYFSSEGHRTMGGFDIFYTTIDNENRVCTTPENIGYPINTTEDDVFFIPTPDGKRAYYATNNTGGYGESDLYLITFPEREETNLSVMTGTLSLEGDGNLSSAHVYVTDSETDENIGIYTPNSKSGKYLFILTPGLKYEVLYEATGYVRYLRDLYVPIKTAYQKIQGTTKLEHVTLYLPKEGDEISLDQTTGKDEKEYTEHFADLPDDLTVPCNILFDFDEFTPNSEHPELDTLVKYLKLNPSARIEIIGHTDSQGAEIYNIHLSLRRSRYVSDYLINKGGKNESVIIRGYGEKYPIAINTNPDGSFNEEAQVYNRRVDFKVVQQGEPKLFFKRISVPEKYKL